MQKRCAIASLLLVSVGHERETVRFMKKLAGNSLHESGCELTHFATRGELSEVRRLLQGGMNANGAQYMHPQFMDEPTLVPLVAAARFGNVEMVRLILEYQTDPKRAEHPNKHTFLHAAAQHGHCQVRVIIGAKQLSLCKRSHSLNFFHHNNNLEENLPDFYGGRDSTLNYLTHKFALKILDLET